MYQLEQFLISNRTEYMKHSSKNYTAEQKQFNNSLTERLIKLADKHHYLFDPEEFNFVGIRDRIRCYYKSHVQTQRKKGLLEMPKNSCKKNKDSSGSKKGSSRKKAKPKDQQEKKEVKVTPASSKIEKHECKDDSSASSDDFLKKSKARNQEDEIKGLPAGEAKKIMMWRNWRRQQKTGQNDQSVRI